ncbi:MAG: S8 family serine peptidase [Candidatus Methylomirabilales bacterium]
MGRARRLMTLLGLAALIAGQASPEAGAFEVGLPEKLLSLADLRGAMGRAPDEGVLVHFRPGASGSVVLDTLNSVGARQVGAVYGSDVRILRGTALLGPALAEALMASGSVEYAEPDYTYRISLTDPADARFSKQYAHRRIQSVAGWSLYPGSYDLQGGPTVAVIDTGVDAAHEDLIGKVDREDSACFIGLLCLLSGFSDTHGHGTHVAGVIAATANNGKGVAGVAFNSRIMGLKVCSPLGTCPLSAVASALNWARERGAKVVNMSLGGPASSTLARAVKEAQQAGLVLVAAAGNDGSTILSYPAAYPEVVSVGATDSHDRRARFSNRNSDVELVAPGVGILSTYTLGLGLLAAPTLDGYAFLSGTSMAAPHVSGLAALLVGQNPGWTNTQVVERMHACADDLGPPGRDASYGFGRINVTRALGGC